jgi:hypothetical protein
MYRGLCGRPRRLPHGLKSSQQSAADSSAMPQQPMTARDVANIHAKQADPLRAGCYGDLSRRSSGECWIT